MDNKTKKVIRAVAGVVPRRPSIPVTANVLLESAGDGRVTITANDLEQAVRFETSILGIPRGEWLMPKSSLELLVKGVEFDKLFKLSDVKPFPRFQPHDKSAIPQKFPQMGEVVKAIRKGIVFASRESSRTWTSGVFMGTRHKVFHLCTTDGKRLYFKKLGEDNIQEFMLPRAFADTITKLEWDDEVDFVLTQKKVYFKDTKVEYSCDLLDVSFPEIQRVYPQHEKSMVISGESVKVILNELGIISKMFKGVREAWDAVMFQAISAGITLEVYLRDVGTELVYTSDLIPIVEPPPEATSVGLNYNYFKDSLNALINSGNIEIRFKGELSPVLFYPEGEVKIKYGGITVEGEYVVQMPVRFTKP